MSRLLLLLPLLAACDGRVLILTVAEEATTTIDRGTILEELVADLGFGDFLNMDITASQELQNQGVEPGDIVDARLTEFSLAVDSPEGADLSFLESVELYVESPDLPRVLVASADAFADAAAVDFAVEDEDLVAAFVLSVGVTGQGVQRAIDGG